MYNLNSKGINHFLNNYYNRPFIFGRIYNFVLYAIQIGVRLDTCGVTKLSQYITVRITLNLSGLLDRFAMAIPLCIEHPY